jgi:hypothetical protein
MFNKEDIIARLMAGDTVDDIAQEITKALNDAQADYQAQQAEATKLEYGKRILQTVLDYMTTFHANSALTKELVAEGITDESAREAYKMLDQSVEMVDSFGRAIGSLESMFAKSPAPAQIKRDAVSADPVGDFLRANGLA